MLFFLTPVLAKKMEPFRANVRSASCKAPNVHVHLRFNSILERVAALMKFIPDYWMLLLCYRILHEAHCSRKGWSVSLTGEGPQRENELLAYTGLPSI